MNYEAAPSIVFFRTSVENKSKLFVKGTSKTIAVKNPESQFRETVFASMPPLHSVMLDRSRSPTYLDQHKSQRSPLLSVLRRPHAMV
jgi:hypothetical protein